MGLHTIWMVTFRSVLKKDALTGTGVEVADAVFTGKLGVVVTENQQEEFFSHIP